MKRIMKFLVLGLCLIVVPAVAMADSIGVFKDTTGRSFCLTPGFSTTNAIIHRSRNGSTGSRFKLMVPAGAVIQAFSSPLLYIGDLATDMTVAYGECKTGPIVLGTIIWTLPEGMVRVAPSDILTRVVYYDCEFAEIQALGLRAESTSAPVGICGPRSGARDGYEPGTLDGFVTETESSTWGHIKAMYR